MTEQVVRASKIPLPAVAEQRQTAATLDKADAIRRKRREGLRLLDAFLRSAFLEMFGDPVRNEKGWEMVRAGALFRELRYGTSIKCSGAQKDRDLPVLRIPNIVHGDVLWQNLKYARLRDSEIAQLTLVPGDLLFVRTNGNPEYIGRCAVFEGGRTALFASYLIRGRVADGTAYRPRFLKHVLSFPTFRARLVAEARTTAGNFNLSTEGMRRLQVVRPPVQQQDSFLSIDDHVRLMRVKMIDAAVQADLLFAALGHWAFWWKG